MTSVTVLCPNARRCPIKVSPGKLLREVLDEACLKQGYDANSCELVHQKKKVDIALPFRLSGLPNNATLELVQSVMGDVSTVEIALQLPDGSRKLMPFPCDTTLFTSLDTFSKEVAQDLTSTSEAGIPSCAFMNKQYRGEIELRATTLRSMGIRSGRSLIRYQRLSLTLEELAAIAERVEQERHKKESLDADFDRRRAENEQREKIERERMQRFEAEQQRRAEEESKRQTAAEPARTEHGSSEMDTSGPTFHSRDRLPSPPRADPNAWSFDQHAFAQPNGPPPASDSRLAHLQSLLNSVDNSLSGLGGGNGAVNGFIEQLAERGRVPVGRLGQPQPSTNDDQFPLRNFRFPDAPANTSVVVAQSEQNISREVPTADRRTITFRKSELAAAPEQSSSNGGVEIDDRFFDVSVEDLKIMQRELSEQVKREQQRALLPRSFVEARNQELKLAAWRNTVIRVVLRDRNTLQANFYSSEPSVRIYEWFRSLLSSPCDFELNLALHTPLESSDTKTLVDVGVAPACTIYAKFKSSVDDHGSIFNRGMITTASDHEAEMLSREWLSGNTAYTPWTGIAVEEPRTAAGRRMADAGRGEGVGERREPPKMPKWMKK